MFDDQGIDVLDGVFSKDAVEVPIVRDHKAGVEVVAVLLPQQVEGAAGALGLLALVLGTVNETDWNR